MAQMEKSMVYELEPQGGLAHQGLGFRFRTLGWGLGIHSLLPLRDGSVSSRYGTLGPRSIPLGYQNPLR